jgi:PAS domain-containing protein
MFDPAESLPPAAALRSGDLAWQALIDLLDCGIVVWDTDARLVICNDDFRRLYAPIAEHSVPGLPFETLLRLALGAGLLPQAAADEPAFIADRLRIFGNPGAPIERRMPDGRWRRIDERRLADGGVLSYSTDISELVQHRAALQQALADARLAREQLEDAIEALPAGFELWDTDDRLLMANTELARMYPRIAPALQPGVSLETLVHANHAAGALRVPDDDLEAHIARRQVERTLTHSATEHETGDGRWFRIYQRPTRHGALVGVRVDVSELHAQRAAAQRALVDAEAARRRLVDAIEVLPDGFALYDADDRLLLCNQRYRELYRESAAAFVPGASFEQLLRHGLERGQYPKAQGQEDEWLAPEDGPSRCCLCSRILGGKRSRPPAIASRNSRRSSGCLPI